MTTQAAQDYLTKEVFIRKSVVTFRSLSRELGIHVDDAKNELKAFYQASTYTDTLAVPTYLVSGEVTSKKGAPSNAPDDYDMDLDFEDENRLDVVNITKVVLVDAEILDETVAQYSRIFSVHVYSLSPSKLKDADLICASNVNVQKVDASRGPESFPIVGKIRGAHVEMRIGSGNASSPAPAFASSSKTTLEETKAQPSKATPEIKPEQLTLQGRASLDSKELSTTSEAMQKTEIKEKPKPSGKLNWSNGKSKEKGKVKDKGNAEDKSASKAPYANRASSPPSKLGSSNRSSSISGVSKVKTDSTGATLPTQRGLKRKSQIPFDSEEEEEALKPSKPVAPSTSAKVKNGVVLSSDDEQEQEAPAFRRRCSRVKNGEMSDTEMSLKVMMDIDDDQVVRGSRMTRVPPQPDVEEDTEVEIEEATVPLVSSDADNMDTDDEPVVKSRKRIPKKVVPVGRNGLKKKRVVKTRTTTDAKKYMQTEDYSSYESVEEGDVQVEVEQATKSKGKGRKGSNEQPKTEEPPTEKQSGKSKPKAVSKAAPKPKGGAVKRGSLLNFFGPDKDKK
ncbi:DNA polymerase subunit Cdc27 [Pisolithus croceorrhizus]|nr:DNA polymerase subunit Cdc27 [Pisolithus croceorrhizus]KAI6148238.1 DNA polymerase subunit Cdc27 [Pisolithus thermaeus]